MKKSKRHIIKWILYAGLMFLFFILQTTPGLFSIAGVQPVFLYTLPLCVAFFEQELPSAVFAVFCGLLADYSGGRPLGFTAFFLVIGAVFISLLTKYLIRSNFSNFLLCSLCFQLVMFHIDFFFVYLIWGHSDIGVFWFSRTLPILVYSVVVSPLFYLIYRKIATKFNKPFEHIITNLS